MKKSKKNLLLLLSLSMSATLFAACGFGGDKDDSSSSAGGNVQGEQLANEAAWAQALSGSAAATNATVEMTMKMEDRAGDMFEKYDGTQSVKVADGKFYGIEAFDASWRFEEDGVLDEDSEHDEDQTYIATVDGVTTVYFKELGNDWQVYPYEEEGRGAFSATVGFILDYCAEFNLDRVGTMYQDFTYNGGAYTFSKTEDGFENTAELKFENGRLVWGKISENGSFSFEGQNATSTYEVSFSISYGGTTIGALPGQEEEPDVELPDTSVEIPETEGAPVANADEWNTIMQNTLAATNATIITMASERDEVMENGIVMVAGGKSYKRWTNKDGSTSHIFYGEVEGHSYKFTSDDGENWEITQTEWTPEDYAIVGDELSGLDKMLLFENATWNADKGMYVGTSGEGEFSLKISDGKVVYISFYMESAMMPGVDVVYQIVYGNTAEIILPAMDKEEPELPGGGDVEIPDTEGEQIKDAETWNAVWEKSYAADNLVAISTYEEDGEFESVNIQIADGKYYEVFRDDSGFVDYTIKGMIDGRSYKWYSDDGKTWEVEEIFQTPDIYARGCYVFGTMNKMASFENAKWDANSGAYIISLTENGMTMTIAVKISDGYVVELDCSQGTAKMTYRVAYGVAEVGDLPELDKEEIVGEEIKTADDWAKVVANTQAQTNFIYTTTGQMVDEDGKIYVITETNWVDNGKVYMEQQERVTTNTPGGSSSMGAITRCYQGYVNGVGYEWTDMGGGEWHASQADLSEDYDDLHILSIILDEIDFAKAQFNAETGAYIFPARSDIAAFAITSNVETASATIEIKIVNSLICSMKYVDGKDWVECVVEYGTAKVELPFVNDGGNHGVMGEGERVDAQGWESAMQATKSSPVCRVRVEKYRTAGAMNFDVQDIIGTIDVQVADDKVRFEMRAQNDVLYGYYGNVDGKQYRWTSQDQKNWSCMEMGDKSPLDGAWLLADLLFVPEDIAYEDFTCDEEMYGYTYTTGSEYITIGFKDGRILYVITGYYDEEMGVNCADVAIFSYGGSVGNLPPVEDVKPNNPSTPEYPEGGDVEVIVPEIDWDKTLGDDIVGEEVSEDEFYAALERTAAAKNFTVRGYAGSSYMNENNIALGVTYVADDKMYNYTAMYMVEEGKTYNGSFSVYIGTVDGTEYIWYSQDGSTYESDYAENQGIAGMCNGNLLLAYLGTGDYSMYTFNAETGAYEMSVEVATDVTIHYTLKIVDGLLVAFTMDSAAEDLDQKFVIEYGTASVGDLPPVGEVGGDVEVFVPVMDWDETLGDDIIGEEVDQAGFDEAIQNTYESQNMTSKQYVDMGNMEVVSAGYFADEKMYSVSTVSGQNGDGTTFTATQYTYAGWVDGVSYAWMSMDGRNWDTMKGEECGLVGYENGAYFSRYLAEFNYGSCTFDEKTGAYVLNTPDDSYQAIKITQGKVSAIIYVMKSEMTNSDGTTSQTTTVERCVIEYGTAEVGELPPVSSGGENSYPITARPTEAEWDEAFAVLLNATNYSMKQMQNVWYYDGSKTIDIVSGIKLTETAAWQEMSQTVVTTEGQTNTTNLIVWTNENGVDYQYTFSQENQVWGKKETPVTMDRLFEQMNTKFEVFVDMYDVMEWDGIRGCFFVPEYTFVTETGEKGNTFYNIVIFIQNRQIIQIEYEMRNAEYERKESNYFYDYDMTEVQIPVEGEGYTGNGDENVDNGGDVVIGGEQEDKEEIINGTVTFD